MLGIFFIYLFVIYLYLTTVFNKCTFCKKQMRLALHNVMLIKVKSICDSIHHDKRSETRYPLPQINPHPQTHFLVCMQITLGLSREPAPCPLIGANGANNP